MPEAFIPMGQRFAQKRLEQIAHGLRRAGWTVTMGAPPAGRALNPNDLAVVWCRHKGAREAVCRQIEKAGGRALICEEAQVKAGKRGEKLFSLCLDDHHGAGDWPIGGSERWIGFGIELAPWNTAGEKIVVREQRGIGSKRMGSPPGWHDKTAQRLKAAGWPVEIRPHPKNVTRRGGVPVPLEKQLADAWALVTWSSSDAVGAVIAGCPTIVCAPKTFLPGCVGRDFDYLSAPLTGPRLPALERLAWCQWTLDEIRNGEPFRRIMEHLS